MSWFTSMFSSKPSSAPNPAASIHEPQRILEEPTSQSKSPSLPPADLQKRPNNDETPSQLNPNRSKMIFGAGLAFCAFSILITRRAFARRRLASNPAFYTNGPAHHEQQAATVSGPVEAVEALSLATINVLSVTMMATGGVLWYLDINSMSEARRLIRGGLGVDGTGRSEEQAEEEFEEWMASTLARKENKGKIMEAVQADRAKREKSER